MVEFNRSNYKLSIVIPCFNEEEVITEIYSRLSGILKSLNCSYQILFVDDGSRDRTVEIIEQFRVEDKQVDYISFSRNFGHQAALKAGLDHADGDCVISMDADLQHPPEMIVQFIDKWKEGYDIVYSQRLIEKDLPVFKKTTSKLFYTLLNKISDTPFEEGIADFRLLDRAVVNVIKNSAEANIFLRGFISWMGFKSYKIQYYPEKRFAGETKYSFSKMLALALNGLTSFSVKPLNISIFIGLILSSFAFLYIFYILAIYFFTDTAVSGWSSVIISILLIGGIQLIILGIIGQYLGRLFIQSKQRPDYIIKHNNTNSNDKREH